MGAAGELYAVNLWGDVHRLVDADPSAPREPLWPATLGETGCFADLPSRALADGVIRYDLNVLDARARAYLHSNCAHCHQPGGPTPTPLDLRFGTPLAETAACDALPTQDLGVQDARVIAPGAPERSVLWLRMASQEGAESMPLLARQRVDTEAVGLVGDWIGALGACAE